MSSRSPYRSQIDSVFRIRSLPSAIFDGVLQAVFISSLFLLVLLDRPAAFPAMAR